MGDTKIELLRDVVKYNVKRPYFGKLTAEKLDAAYGLFKHTQDWDKPIVRAHLNIGHIDGVVICRALWNEMSYNPLRFGTKSPFLHNGVENIYHFCRNGVPEDFPAYKIVERIRHKMIAFMMLNGRANNNQWRDNIDTYYGRITIRFVHGHSDANYKLLSMLREMIRSVASQNLKDFGRKAYRTEMIKVIMARHPNGVRDGTLPMVSKPREMLDAEMVEDRMDDAEDSARITAENCKYVPEEQYSQACADLNRIAVERAAKTK